MIDYKKLPLKATRMHYWMSPLTFAGFAVWVAPLLFVQQTQAAGLMIAFLIVSFGGLFLVAYDHKWATYHANKAGLDWHRNRESFKWERIA